MCYWRFYVLYSYIFIRIILDSYLNHIFGNLNIVLKLLFINPTLVIKSCLMGNFVIVSLFFLIADYYDLEFGIIPNKISLIFFIYGLLFNLLLSGLFNNPSNFLFSIVLTALVALISFLLWHIGFWGGGDFKIFIGLSLALSYLDLSYFNCFSLISINLLNDFNSLYFKKGIASLNLPIFNQFILYPKVFSILLNGILMAFSFISLMLFYNVLKNKQLKYYSKVSIFDFKSMFNKLTTKTIDINDLSEGMVLDKYYFKNEKAFDLIKGGEEIVMDKKAFHLINENKEDNIKNEEENYSNLNAYKEEDIFYFSSLNRIGITKYDIDLINCLYKQDLIKNPNFKIKKGIPFMPFLTLGYVCFLIFGDLISIISSFIKFLF